MNNVLKLINKRIRNAKKHLEYNGGELYKDIWKNRLLELNLLKREILNEAVVCGSEKQKTTCPLASVFTDRNSKVAKYCLECKREFNVFGEEITS